MSVNPIVMSIEKSNSSAVFKRKSDFLSTLRRSLEEGIFIKAVLSRYTGSEDALLRVNIRSVIIKGSQYLSIVKQYKDRDVTENQDTESAVGSIELYLEKSFKSAHLLTSTKDYHLDCDKKGVFRLTSGRHACSSDMTDSHDRQKKRLIDRRRPFLSELGITDTNANVFPSMSDKWKQINKFIEFLEHAVRKSGLLSLNSIAVTDFGCGKGYLTFAVHDYLQHSCKVRATVVGVELKDHLVSFCNNVAGRLNCDGLSFTKGDVETYRPLHADILMALHACDTATDMALYMGIEEGSKVIICAPCCHKQLRPQMVIPEILRPMLRFGSHLSQEADMITDSLRVLLLEAKGYDVDLFEFISLEHTGKNRMIVGIKRDKPRIDTDKILRQIAIIKEFYGIKEHKLESLLTVN